MGALSETVRIVIFETIKMNTRAINNSHKLFPVERHGEGCSHVDAKEG